MTHDEKTAAAEFFFSINSQITGLWGIYIAATFTGAGFSLASAGGVSPVEATLAAAGFSIFAIGHYHLIRNAVTRLNGLREKILNVTAASDRPDLFPKDFEPGKTAFDGIVLIATHPTGPWSRSAVAHIAIDLCVVALIFRAQIAGVLD